MLGRSELTCTDDVELRQSWQRSADLDMLIELRSAGSRALQNARVADAPVDDCQPASDLRGPIDLALLFHIVAQDTTQSASYCFGQCVNTTRFDTAE